MKFVLWGTYCENALEKRTPYREEHLAGLQQVRLGWMGVCACDAATARGHAARLCTIWSTNPFS